MDGFASTKLESLGESQDTFVSSSPDPRFESTRVACPGRIRISERDGLYVSRAVSCDELRDMRSRSGSARFHVSMAQSSWMGDDASRGEKRREVRLNCGQLRGLGRMGSGWVGG